MLLLRNKYYLKTSVFLPSCSQKRKSRKRGRYLRGARREGLEVRRGGMAPDTGRRGTPNPREETRSQEESYGVPPGRLNLGDQDSEAWG